MLFTHFTNGGELDTLSFETVSPDDPSVTSPEYIRVPSDALPEVKGADLWQRDLPVSGEPPGLAHFDSFTRGPISSYFENL